MRMHACMKSSRESNNRILLRLRRDYFGVYSCQYENVNGHGLLEETNDRSIHAQQNKHPGHDEVGS